MNKVLDFDYLIISNQLFDPASIQKTMQFFFDRGIRKFIFTYATDLTSRSLLDLRSSMRQIGNRILSLSPYGCKACICPELLLTRDVVRNPSISALQYLSSSHILLRMPWFNSYHIQDWLENDLNFLLYKQHLSPIFVSFESNIRSNSKDLIDRLLHASGLSFSMDLNFMSSASETELIKQLLDFETPIFPILSNPLSCYPGILDSMALLKKRLGNDSYIKFCRMLHQSGRTIQTVI